MLAASTLYNIGLLLQRIGEKPKKSSSPRRTRIALLSIANVFVAKLADGADLGQFMPAISADSIESLLSIMASSR